MELVKQYWWIIALAILALFMFKKGGAGSGPGYNVTQLSTGAGAAVDQTQQTAASLVQTLLGYDLQVQQTAAQQQLAEDQLAAQTAAANSQANQSSYLAQLQYQAQMAQYQSQANLQAQALSAARRAQSESNWFNLIQGIGGQLVPIFAGQGTFGGSGGFQIPGGIGGGYGGWGGGWGGF
jgi:hypothetical protein